MQKKTGRKGAVPALTKATAARRGRGRGNGGVVGAWRGRGDGGVVGAAGATTTWSRQGRAAWSGWAAGGVLGEGAAARRRGSRGRRQRQRGELGQPGGVVGAGELMQR